MFQPVEDVFWLHTFEVNRETPGLEEFWGEFVLPTFSWIPFDLQIVYAN